MNTGRTPLGALLLVAVSAAPAGAHAGSGAAGDTGVTGIAGVLVHTYLVSSVPADGDSLPAAPGSIRLVFNEPVEAALSGIDLVSARGSIEVSLLADSLDARTLIGELPPLLPAEYRVDWRVVSADGHPVEGSYRFTVLAPVGSADSVPSVAPAPAHPSPAPGHGSGPGLTAAAGVSGVLRGFAMFALLVLTGWLVQLVALEGTPPNGVMRAAFILACLATAFLAGHFVSWLLQVTPSGRSPDLGAALATGPGRVEAVRLALALLCLWAIGLAGRPWVGLMLALAVVLVSGAVGHSAAIAPRWSIPLKSLHLIAIAVWMGGVAWLALAALDPLRFGQSAARVSGMALGAVLVVAVTGVGQSALLLPDLGSLFASTYGRLVLAKAAGLGGLVVFGAWNRQRLIPRLVAGSTPDALRSSTRRELALMLAVSLVAGVLAYVSPPPS